MVQGRRHDRRTCWAENTIFILLPQHREQRANPDFCHAISPQCMATGCYVIPRVSCRSSYARGSVVVFVAGCVILLLRNMPRSMAGLKQTAPVCLAQRSKHKPLVRDGYFLHFMLIGMFAALTKFKPCVPVFQARRSCETVMRDGHARLRRRSQITSAMISSCIAFDSLGALLTTGLRLALWRVGMGANNNVVFWLEDVKGGQSS